MHTIEIFIFSTTNKCGKSLIARQIEQLLKNHNIEVDVFDEPLHQEAIQKKYEEEHLKKIANKQKVVKTTSK